jgi:hypothetical protein
MYGNTELTAERDTLAREVNELKADAEMSNLYVKRMFAAEARVEELEAQLRGLLPAAQPLITSIEFLPLAMANPLAEMTKRAEAAEQLLMVYRVLLTGAMMEAGYTGGLPPVMAAFANEYFKGLFQVALDSGSFVEAGCGTVGILAAAEQLHVKFLDAEESARV